LVAALIIAFVDLEGTIAIQQFQFESFVRSLIVLIPLFSLFGAIGGLIIYKWSENYCKKNPSLEQVSE